MDIVVHNNPLDGRYMMALFTSRFLLWLLFLSWVPIVTLSKECHVPPKLHHLDSIKTVTINFESHSHIFRRNQSNAFGIVPRVPNLYLNEVSYSKERNSFFIAAKYPSFHDENMYYILEVSWTGDLKMVLPLGSEFGDIEALVYTRDNKVVVAEEFPASFVEIDLIKAVDGEVLRKGQGPAAAVFDIALPISSVPAFGIQGLSYAPEFDAIVVASARAYPRIFAVRLETGEFEQLFRVHHLSVGVEGLAVGSIIGLDYETEMIDGAFLAVSDGVDEALSSGSKHLIRIGTDMQIDKLVIVEELGIGEGTFVNLTGFVKGVASVSGFRDIAHSGTDRYGIALVSSDSQDIVILHGEYFCGIEKDGDSRFGGVCPHCVYSGIFCSICDDRRSWFWYFTLLTWIPIPVLCWCCISCCIVKSNGDRENGQYQNKNRTTAKTAEDVEYSTQIKLLAETQ